MDWNPEEIIQYLENTWKIVALIVSSVYAAFYAWHKKYNDYWTLRKLRSLTKLSESTLNSDEEYAAFEQLKEEERFRLAFGRPSTPIFRQLVWQHYEDGLFTSGQFRAARIYFDTDEDNLEIKFGKSEKVSTALNLFAMLVIVLALFIFTHILLREGSKSAFFYLLVTFAFLIPAMGFFMKELMGLLTARAIKKELKRSAQSQSECDKAKG